MFLPALAMTMSVIISPLHGLMEQQISHLHEVGVVSCNAAHHLLLS